MKTTLLMKVSLAVMATGLAIAASTASAADANAGSQIFKQKCMACHTITPGAKGAMAPNLSGLANRAAASTEFDYSAALRKSKLKWDAATLSTFLTAPSRLVSGTRMIVNVPDDAKRADLVAYLMTLKK